MGVMARDDEDVFERVMDPFDLGGRARLALIIILLAGAAGAGVAVIAGTDALVPAVVGAVIAAVVLMVLWVRARRRGTTVFGED